MFSQPTKCVLFLRGQLSNIKPREPIYSQRQQYAKCDVYVYRPARMSRFFLFTGKCFIKKKTANCGHTCFHAGINSVLLKKIYFSLSTSYIHDNFIDTYLFLVLKQFRKIFHLYESMTKVQRTAQESRYREEAVVIYKQRNHHSSVQ